MRRERFLRTGKASVRYKFHYRPVFAVSGKSATSWTQDGDTVRTSRQQVSDVTRWRGEGVTGTLVSWNVALIPRCRLDRRAAGRRPGRIRWIQRSAAAELKLCTDPRSVPPDCRRRRTSTDNFELPAFQTTPCRWRPPTPSSRCTTARATERHPEPPLKRTHTHAYSCLTSRTKA